MVTVVTTVNMFIKSSMNFMVSMVSIATIITMINKAFIVSIVFMISVKIFTFNVLMIYAV